MEEESDYGDLIKVIQELSKQKKEELAQLPYHFNVISSAARGNLKEIAHTMILADLLNDPKIQNSFLNYFFCIDINDLLEVKREIREELGQPDIVLSNKEKYFIIENKVNGAPEGDKQCGRYYLIARDKYSYDPQNIYFLYLNPDNRKLPSKNTLEIPNDKDLVNDKLGERFIVRSFAYDMREWLDQLYQKLIGSKDEEFLISGIHQYMDYLDCKFETGIRFKTMNEGLERFLAEGSKEFDTVEKLITLKEQAEEVVKTVTNIIFKKNKEIINEIKERNENQFKEYGTSKKEFGIMEEVKEHKFYFNIETNREDNKIFYGIKYNDKDQSLKPEVSEKIKSLVKSKNNEYKEYDLWPIYKYAYSSSAKDIYDEFMTFRKEVLNLLKTSR